MWRNRLHQFLMLILLWLAYGSSYLVRKPLGLIKADLMKDLGVGSDLLGWLDVSLFLPYAGVSLSMGWLAEIVGGRTVFGVGLVVSGACAAGIGQCYSLGMICLLLFGAGASQALCWPSAVSILTKWFKSNEKNHALGVFGTSVFVGSVVSTYFAVIIHKYLGWRAIFIPCGIIPAVFGVLVLAFARSPQEYGVDISGAEGKSVENGISLISDNVGPTPARKVSFLQILRFESVPEASVALFCNKFVRYAVMLWLPLLLEQALHYSPVAAGVGSTAFDIGGTIGSFFSGFIVKRFFRNDNQLASCMMNFFTAFFLFMFFLSQNLGPIFHMFFFFMAGIFNCASNLLLTGPIPADIGTRHNALIAVGGVVNGVGSVGSVLQGPFMGWVSASFGWMSVVPILMVVSMLSGLATYKTYIVRDVDVIDRS